MGTKVIKSSPSSDAGIVVAENLVRITAKESNGITVDEKGVIVQGPVSFVSGSDSIRVGALWTFNSTMPLSLPSTLATPSPVFNIDPPTKAIAGLVEDASIMIALLFSLI
jgi:hypothetical protein